MQITNNTFSNIGSTGIYVDGFSDVLIESNTISPAEPGDGWGVYCVAASPKLLMNTIENFTEGLTCLIASSPILEDGISPGCNLISNSLAGVTAKVNQMPCWVISAERWGTKEV
jgi:hypothetical protein